MRMNLSFLFSTRRPYLLLVLPDHMVEEVALGSRRMVRLQVLRGEEHKRPAAVLKHGPLAAFGHLRLAERANADENLRGQAKPSQGMK